MKKYWKSLEELKQMSAESGLKKDPEPGFPGDSDKQAEDLSLKASRRDFLKMLGFSVGYATLAQSCEQPVRKAIPYLNKPEEITPGISSYYASTFYDGDEYCPVVVKVRDGRPIKIEGNELSSLTHGGTGARIQASVLNLYDSARLQYPAKDGAKTDWQTSDSEIMAKLKSANDSGRKIAILSSTVISPSTLKILESFRQVYPMTEIIFYDPVSYSASVMVTGALFGGKGLPDYRFDKARVIAGFNADFLGTWLSPVSFAYRYGLSREIGGDKKQMSKHYQFESCLSLTGSNADYRRGIKPSQEKNLLMNLYNELAVKAGSANYGNPSTSADISTLVDDLWDHRGESIVVSGTNDPDIQTLVAGINLLLGNYGHTIDLNCRILIKQGTDKAVEDFVERMNHGEIEALILHHVNPLYHYHDPEKFLSGMKNLKLSVAIAEAGNETTAHADYICPDHHYLESWNDAEPGAGIFSLAQPCIRNFFDTRQAQETFMTWAGMQPDYHAYLKDFWKENMFPVQDKYTGFEDFWLHTLQEGIFEPDPDNAGSYVFNHGFFSASMTAMSPDVPAGNGLELVLYEKVGIGSGKHANNPWLQELPDPVSKAVWDNYLAISPLYAGEQGIEYEDVVLINGAIELPVLLQPGQPHGTASIALGYGRTGTGKVADGIGKNVFGLAEYKNSTLRYSGIPLIIEKTGKKYNLATTQTHHSAEGRPLIRETVLGKWAEHPDSGNEMHAINEKNAVTLYQKPVYDGFHWGLGVDLNRCIGCSACVIACQAENNIAVIGKEQVRNRRIMHWLRIDRYFSTVEPDKMGPEEFSNLEPENPEVVFQPVMCQHCDNAPCENVCPVAATPHSKEGLNQMAYNRCIGTRYCMNNCPYRVRRFNWFQFSNNDNFDYNFNEDLSKMVLNPDVTVRSRGVVEKCSFCVQRIQEQKLEAKKDGRFLEDGEIKPACVQACPSKALVFGDRNDKESAISGFYSDPRMYHLLEELHTLSSVAYLTRIRNRDVTDGKNDDHHS
ncbi:MAG: TAT-variant-translocated molybdopterin oxidoreductase [Bacteroidales bacterium]|nr:TAT-variant-translocated molybdopterin oxidoreductase [Bacteroidales bacterium]